MITGWVRRILSGTKNASEAPVHQTLIYKSNEAAFNVFCKFGQTDLAEKRSIPALVLDAVKEAGAKRSVKYNADGSQLAMIHIAAPDGGWKTVASTCAPGLAPLQPGDLVLWMALETFEAPITNDRRSIWNGLIVAKIAPEWTPDGFRIIEYL